MRLLEGKVAVITGSSRGLGLAIARAYAREGAALVISSRSEQAVGKAVESLVATGARVVGRPADVSDLSQVEKLAATAVEAFGRLDIWVNNAALSAPYGPTVQIQPERYLEVVRTNINGTYNGSLVALRRFLSQGSGKLINLLGRGESGFVPFQNAYAPSKAWTKSFTLALAAENKGSGVGIFAFQPGLMVTDLMTEIEAIGGYEGRLKPLEWVLRTWGNPPEVPAEKAVWLASAATDGKTGLVVRIGSPLGMMTRMVGDRVRTALGRPAPAPRLHVVTVAAEPQEAQPSRSGPPQG